MRMLHSFVSLKRRFLPPLCLIPTCRAGLVAFHLSGWESICPLERTDYLDLLIYFTMKIVVCVCVYVCACVCEFKGEMSEMAGGQDCNWSMPSPKSKLGPLLGLHRLYDRVVNNQNVVLP